MPIEFHCTNCGKLLRTQDGSAGMPAQCPECQTITTVPGTPGTMSPQPGGSPLEAAGPAGSSPFGMGPAPSGPGDADNPYQSPVTTGYIGSASAAGRVAGPAIALIVTASLGLAWHVVSAIINAITLSNGPPVVFQPGQGPEVPQWVFVVAILGGAVLALVLDVVILVGAIRMRKLQSYGLAMAASIIAMIPCVWPCCLLGLPFGIWALVVLSDSSVKAAFR
jgi:hypothetical protein